MAESFGGLVELVGSFDKRYALQSLEPLLCTDLPSLCDVEQRKVFIQLHLCAPHVVDVLMTDFFAITEKDSTDRPRRTGLARYA